LDEKNPQARIHCLNRAMGTWQTASQADSLTKPSYQFLVFSFQFSARDSPILLKTEN
jgi:hypothetical protein